MNALIFGAFSEGLLSGSGQVHVAAWQLEHQYEGIENGRWKAIFLFGRYVFSSYVSFGEGSSICCAISPKVLFRC